MALSAGSSPGPYEITSPLGTGGMGEVYRARDSRLGRDVAVKVLPGSLANDPDRLRRFEQEARSASLLNHPNILAIHDVAIAHPRSLDAADVAPGEEAWRLEAEARLDQVESGKATLAPGDEVFANVRRRLG